MTKPEKNITKLKAHRSCQTLPLRKAVNLINSKIDNGGLADARHILVVDEWPEDYNDPELPDIVDKIMLEWEELRGQKFYSHGFRKIDFINRDRNRINALGLAFEAKKLHKIYFDLEFKEICDNILANYKFKNLNTLEQIAAKQQQIINKINKKIGELKEEKSYEKVDVYDLITDIKEHYPKLDITPDITIAEYESWRKKVKNGRRN